MKDHTALNQFFNLLSRDSIHWAAIFASAAIDAGISVDDIFAVALSNSGNWACICTSAAGNAIVVDLISHSK